MRRSPIRLHRLRTIALAALLGCGAPSAERARPVAAPEVAPREFAATVARLSEPGGYFDSDNLISNETSYLDAVDVLRSHGVHGGAYIGVGPDQNFSYIAAVEPAMVYLIDIRRDNLVQHLLYRALFTVARNRAEYLLLLTGRAVPADVARWSSRPVGELLAWVADQPADRAAAVDARARLLATAVAFGVPLTDADTAAMGRIHDAFVQDGLSLRYSSYNRGPNPDYPTFGELLGATAGGGEPASYLATERAFRTVQALERAGRVVPVTGDLAGPHALAAIGRDIAARGLPVSVLYVSNVEFYLMRAGTFDRFAATASALPRDEHSVLIRSCFRRSCGPTHEPIWRGSLQLVQPLDSLAALHRAGALRSYGDVVSRGLIRP